MLLLHAFWTSLALITPAVLAVARYDHICLDNTIPVPRKDPPRNTVTVAQDGSGAFKTIQEAVQHQIATKGPRRIFIKAGFYSGTVNITGNDWVIFGATDNICNYTDNTVRITGGLHVVNKADDIIKTSTLILDGNGINIFNLIIENTGAGIQNSQALALTTKGSNIGIYGCNLYSEQDTWYAPYGSQLMVNSLIMGDTDFIFGNNAIQVITKSDIIIPYLANRKSVHMTASGRAGANEPGIILIDKSRVLLGTGSEARKPGSVDLGRVWKEYARVQYQQVHFFDDAYTKSASVWSPPGFVPMKKGDDESIMEHASLTYVGLIDGPDPSNFSKYVHDGQYMSLTSVFGTGIYPQMFDYRFV